MRIVTGYALLVTAILFTGCQSPEDRYREAVDLLAGMKFAEAKQVFDEVAAEQVDTTVPMNPRAGVLLANVGQLTKDGSLDEAWEALNATTETEVGSETTEVYVLHLDPDDPLFNAAKNVLLWFKVSFREPQIREYLDADYETAWELDGGDIPAEGLYFRVLTSFDYEPQEHDLYEPYDYGYDTPQLYEHAAFDNTQPIGAFTTLLTDDVRHRFEDFKIRIDEKKALVEQWYEDRREAERASAMAFTSARDALGWLGAGSGIWVQDEGFYARTMGMDVKFIQIFNVDAYSGGGTVTMGTVNASTLRDVEKRHTVRTWIISIDGNEVTYAMGSEYATSTMQRTGEHTAILKGQGAMTRQ